MLQSGVDLAPRIRSLARTLSPSDREVARAIRSRLARPASSLVSRISERTRARVRPPSPSRARLDGHPRWPDRLPRPTLPRRVGLPHPAAREEHEVELEVRGLLPLQPWIRRRGLEPGERGAHLGLGLGHAPLVVEVRVPEVCLWSRECRGSGRPDRGVRSLPVPCRRPGARPRRSRVRWPSSGGRAADQLGLVVLDGGGGALLDERQEPRGLARPPDRVEQVIDREKFVGSSWSARSKYWTEAPRFTPQW